MKKKLMQYILCPSCQSSLELMVTKKDEEEIMEGTLKCIKCQSSYPIKQGVPSFITEENISEDEKISSDGFDYEWNKWSDMSGYDKNVEQFFDYVDPITPDFFQGKTILDAGCGMGRWPIIMAENGAAEIIAFDLGASVINAFENTRRYPNVHIVRANIFHMPFNGKFDFVHSNGVIHHTPKPGVAFDCLTRQVKPGGSIFVWIYGYEHNEFIVNVITPIRVKITSRLPQKILSVLSFILAVFLHTIIKTIYMPVSKGQLAFLKNRLPYRDYLFWLGKYNFTHTDHNIYDHLLTPIAFYIKKEEIEDWFNRNALKNICITARNNNSWRGWGFKPVGNK